MSSSFAISFDFSQNHHRQIFQTSRTDEKMPQAQPEEVQPVGLVVGTLQAAAWLWIFPEKPFTSRLIKVHFGSNQPPLLLGHWAYSKRNANGQYSYEPVDSAFVPPLDVKIDVKGAVEIRAKLLLGKSTVASTRAWSPDLGLVGGFFDSKLGAGLYEASLHWIEEQKREQVGHLHHFELAGNNPMEQVTIFEHNTEGRPLMASKVVHTAVVVEEFKNFYVFFRVWSRSNGLVTVAKRDGIQIGDWIQYTSRIYGYGMNTPVIRQYSKIGTPLKTVCSDKVVAVKVDKIMENEDRVCCHLLGHIQGSGCWALWNGSGWRLTDKQPRITSIPQQRIPFRKVSNTSERPVRKSGRRSADAGSENSDVNQWISRWTGDTGACQPVIKLNSFLRSVSASAVQSTARERDIARRGRENNVRKELEETVRSEPDAQQELDDFFCFSPTSKVSGASEEDCGDRLLIRFEGVKADETEAPSNSGIVDGGSDEASEERLASSSSAGIAEETNTETVQNQDVDEAMRLLVEQLELMSFGNAVGQSGANESDNSCLEETATTGTPGDQSLPSSSETSEPDEVVQASPTSSLQNFRDLEEIRGIVVHSNLVGFNRLAVCSLQGNVITLLKHDTYKDGSSVQVGEWVYVLAKSKSLSRYYSVATPERLPEPLANSRIGPMGEPELETVVKDIYRGSLGNIAVSDLLGDITDADNVLPLNESSPKYIVWCHRIEPASDRCHWSLVEAEPYEESLGGGDLLDSDFE